VAGAFLVEFLSEGRYPILSRLTEGPRWEHLTLPTAEIMLVSGSRNGAPLVLVHGFAPHGNRDDRVVAAASLLARTGFAVAVPTIPGLTQGRLRPHDTEPVIAALDLRPGPATLVTVSVGAGPALLAAADPRVRGRVATVVVLGGYASARELVRFFLTGEYEYGDRRGRTVHDPEVVRAFLAANADLLDPQILARLAAGNRQATEIALDAIAPLLEALSPERVAPRIPGRIVLVHGRGDRAVPYTETLRLAAARPLNTTVVLVGMIGHVETTAPASQHLRDLLALWGVAYTMIAGR
jgi:pimeloyl-ACP methyl ester carboxylesterase